MRSFVWKLCIQQCHCCCFSKQMLWRKQYFGLLRSRHTASGNMFPHTCRPARANKTYTPSQPTSGIFSQTETNFQFSNTTFALQWKNWNLWMEERQWWNTSKALLVALWHSLRRHHWKLSPAVITELCVTLVLARTKDGGDSGSASLCGKLQDLYFLFSCKVLKCLCDLCDLCDRVQLHCCIHLCTETVCASLVYRINVHNFIDVFAQGLSRRLEQGQLFPAAVLGQEAAGEVVVRVQERTSVRGFDEYHAMGPRESCRKDCFYMTLTTSLAGTWEKSIVLQNATRNHSLTNQHKPT